MCQFVIIITYLNTYNHIIGFQQNKWCGFSCTVQRLIARQVICNLKYRLVYIFEQYLIGICICIPYKHRKKYFPPLSIKKKKLKLIFKSIFKIFSNARAVDNSQIFLISICKKVKSKLKFIKTASSMRTAVFC